jgi:hypothetical protein
VSLERVSRVGLDHPDSPPLGAIKMSKLGPRGAELQRARAVGVHAYVPSPPGGDRVTAPLPVAFATVAADTLSVPSPLKWMFDLPYINAALTSALMPHGLR